MIVEQVQKTFVTIEGVRFEKKQSMIPADLYKVERIVCDEYSISERLLRTHLRQYPYNDARHITWFILHHLYNGSKSSIARYYERNHTSVLDSLRTMEAYIEKQDGKIMPHFRNIIQKLKEVY